MSWTAFALSALIGVSAALLPAGSASAVVPAGYVVASGWSTGGTGSTATQIGATTYLGPVTSTASNQIVGMDAAWTVDGTAVPRRQLTAATITASTTACLNGAPVDTLRECNGPTSKITTIVFPVPTVNPIIAVATRGAVVTVPATGTGTKTYCSTAWLDHTVTSVSGSSAFTRSQVTALTVPAGQRYNAATTELYFDPTLMSPTANECLAPASGTGTVAYLQVQGVVSSVQFQTRYRAMVTRNNAPVQTTRTAAVPPGWQVQPMFAQADLAVTKSASTQVPATGDVEWRLNVTNKGAGPSHGFQVDDIVPLGIADVSVASSPIPCTIGTETIGGVARQVVHCAAEPPDCIVVPDPTIPGWAEPLCDVENALVPSVLAAGASVGPIVLRGRAGPSPGQVANSATVSGADLDPVRTDNTATASTQVVAASPAVSLAGAVTPTGPVALAPGATVSYTVTVTNAGDIPLTEAIVEDTAWSGAGPAPVVTCPAGAIPVASSISCAASYPITQADIDAGGVSITAQALGASAAGDVSSTPLTLSTTLSRSPALSLAHTGAPTSITAVGQVVTYSYAVTNTGNVSLSDLAVSQDSFSGSGAPPDPTCPVTVLAPGATTTCTADYTVADADKRTTALTSVSTARAAPPASLPAPESTSTAVTDVAIPVPAVTMVGAVDPSGPVDIVPGSALTYSFTVTNAGNTPLTSISVTFSDWVADGDAPTISCAPAPLGVSAEATCTGSYVVTQADIDAGVVTGSAQARADSAGGFAESGTVPLATALLRTAGLSLDHTGAPGTVTSVGQSVTFSFAVTNTGNTSLDGLSVSQDEFSGLGITPTITCPSTVLAPATTVTCTAAYVAVDADVPFVSLSSTATARAAAPEGVDAPQTAGVTASVILSIPALTFTKTADLPDGTTLGAGERLTYTITAVNAGGASLDPVLIVDDLTAVLTGASVDAGATATIGGAAAGALSFPEGELRWTGSLAVGQSVVVAYSVTTDVGPSLLRNSARAEATSAAGLSIVTADASTTHSVRAAAPPSPVDPVDPGGPAVLDPDASPGQGLGGLSASGTDAGPVTALALLGAATLLAGSLLILVGHSGRRPRRR